MGALTKENNTYIHRNSGVCSSAVQFEVQDGHLKNVHFVGGCNGNTQGVAKLAVGMRAEDVIARLRGINCNGRGTSCPDQLSNAIEEALASM